MPSKDYQSYRGLPTLAGLATLAQAAKPGLSVEACVARLKRYHYAFLRLHEILTARITAEPIYELKTGFSHHAYLCSEHVMALRTRIGDFTIGGTIIFLAQHESYDIGQMGYLKKYFTKEAMKYS